VPAGLVEVSESINAKDSLLASTVVSRALSESVLGKDDVATTVEFGTSLADRVIARHSEIGEVVIILSIDEAANAANIDAAWVDFAGVLEEQVGLSEVLGVGIDYNVATLEQIRLLDSPIGRRLWEPIEDTQTPNWQDMDSNTAPGWGVIGTDASQTWQEINSNTAPGWGETNASSPTNWQKINTV
jgi:hypothetical protein